MATDEQRAEVDGIVIELFTDDEDMMGKLLALLCTKPALYATAYKLQGKQAALKKFLTVMRTRTSQDANSLLPASMATDEQKGEVDEIVIKLFADDEDMIGELLVLLCTKPALYATAYRLRGRQAALTGFLTSMMDPHTRTVQEDVPMTDPDTRTVQEDLTMTEEAALRMLAWCQNKFGSQLKRLEDKGIVPKGVIAGGKGAALATTGPRTATIIKRAGNAGNVLTLGMLGYEFSSNICSFWKGEIDRCKCAENLTGACATVGAGYGGYSVGAALVAGAAPAGIVFGAASGAWITSGLTQVAVSKLFHRCFGTDRDRALDKAYGVLRLEKGASPEAIRHAYLNLAREHHPDKPGGDKEEFLKVNGAYELIRALTSARCAN
mmetsp:Transcript_51684/g.116477  ORF Transcript_51684/g.116477 Transcript_51684/m.116477 type:complete len:380 (-) Transcript_51684:80-1219(-)|eukprot:6314528-Amphidinium_carterae.1